MNEPSDQASSDPVIRTARLELRPASLAAVDAMLAKDAGQLETLLDARVPRPFVPPPEIDDALDFFARRLRADERQAIWLLRLIVRTADRAVIGSIGGSGSPGEDGVFLIGYSVYPAHEGQGYGSEAAAGLVAWALAQPGVARVRATISPTNIPSRRIAEKCGMTVTGTSTDDEVGEVLVYERVAR